MKRLIETAEEQNQFLGPNMEKIMEVPILEKMSVLSSLITLTIDIQKILQSWTNFQHHLAVTAPAIVEVCIEKTDYQTSQPTTINSKGQKEFCTSLFLRDEETFCSWGRCWRSKSVNLT